MRHRPKLVSMVLALGLLAPAFAQRPANNPPQPARQQSPQQDEDDEVVRITTNLVQVDAVVTDRDGRHVTDLGPEDFEVLEEGKRQEITNFSYVNVGPDEAAPAAPTPAARAEKGGAVVPPARVKPGRARRTVALVVDDLSLSVESTRQVRRALQKYLDEQVQGDDLSAVLRISSGVGVLQQFTSDRRLLSAAVERVRWHPRSRGGLSAVEPINPLSDQLTVNRDGIDGDKGQTPEESRQERSVGDTIAALTYIVRGLQSLPGRKAVVLFTDGLSMIGGDGLNSNAERMRRLVDLANRSSVVFYAVDARGLQTLDVTAAVPNSQLPPVAASRSMPGGRLGGLRAGFFEAQNGMNYLARETGGLFFRERNDLSTGVRRALDDQRGYYLIGYRPDESTFDQRTGERRFRQLKVQVKRPGLTVRSRAGFYGVASPRADERRGLADIRQELFDALSSPFGAAGVDLRMAALFVNDEAAGSAIRSIIHVKASDLQFDGGADGRRKATMDVAAIVFDSDGRPAVRGRDQRDIVLDEQEYRRVLKNGLTYRLDVPVRQPGAYNVRVAVRDAATGRVGSAREIVSVPDLAKGPLALSGVAVSGVEPSRDGAGFVADQLTSGAGVSAEAGDPGLSPAVRRLRHGVFLDYGYAIYNARVDKATGRPRLTTQVRLFRDGRPIFTGSVTHLDASGQADMKRLVAGGRLQVGTELEPGDYVLQVVVTDTLAAGKREDGKGTATQWVDFEVVK